MYEETKSSIDWKGVFLKVVIAFLIVLIALQGIKMFKGDDKKENTQKETISDSKNSSTFAINLDKLTEAGEKYYEKNPDKIPTSENTTNMVTLNDLINEGYITSLLDENGKNCEVESSYVTAVLEGKRTKIKANLVCGTTFSNASTYLAENTETKKEETVTKQDNAVIATKKEEVIKTNTSNNSNVADTSNTCKTNCGVSSFETKTETKVDNTIIFNEKPEESTTKPVATTKPTTTTTTTNVRPKIYYTVEFDENGGNTSYSNKRVLEYQTVKYPGKTYRSGYTFLGWYLNGREFDFNTPITRNITLVAKFARNDDLEDYERCELYGDCDYRDDDYSRNKSIPTTVYSLMWDNRGTNNISVTHTLRVPSKIVNSYDFDEIRIKELSYYSPLNTTSAVSNYENKFYDTFFYKSNGGEKEIKYENNLSTINKNAVKFKYHDSKEFKDRNDALSNGFDITWIADYVSSQCTRSFSVTNKNTGAYDTNLCAYGIVYEVTWEIR